MKRVIDVSADARPQTFLSRSELGEAPLGETQERHGYSMAVSSVRFDHGGMRVRLTLRRGGQFVRHLDVTSEMCRDLLPILETAAGLGGDAPSSDRPWWFAIPFGTFIERVEQLSLKECEQLSMEMKAAIVGVAADKQVHGGRFAKALELRLTQKHRLLRQRIAVEHDANASENRRLMSEASGAAAEQPVRRLDKDTYAVRMLKLLGDELRHRYGSDGAMSIFGVAKRRLAEQMLAEERGEGEAVP